MRQEPEGRCPHRPVNTEGCGEQHEGMRAGPTCSRSAQRSPPRPTTRHPFHICVNVTSVPRCGVQKETRVNARVQHLREATEMEEREPSLERPPHHQKQGGLVGWRWRGRQEGASEPGGEKGAHLWAVGSLLSSQVGGGGGRAWPRAEPPRDGREVGFSTKINIFEFCLR